MRPGAALHDGRRAHRPHRREPDAEGPVRGRRGGVLGHARLQPPRRQLGRRDRRGRHDRRRVHRRLLRRGRERRQHPDRRWCASFSQREQAKLDALVLTAAAARTPARSRRAMQEIMTAKVGIFRTRRGSRAGRRRAAGAARAQPQHRPALTAPPAPIPSWSTAYRVQKMLKLALCVAYGALVRTKAAARISARTIRAATTREWLKRTLATWPNERDTLPTLRYETLDVKTMELPPGWRGYGAKDYTDHPDTAARQQKSTRSGRSWRRPDASPCRRRSCRTSELLPPRFRGPQRTHRREVL